MGTVIQRGNEFLASNEPLAERLAAAFKEDKIAKESLPQEEEKEPESGENPILEYNDKYDFMTTESGSWFKEKGSDFSEYKYIHGHERSLGELPPGVEIYLMKHPRLPKDLK